jgi:hypothetical protein
VLLVKIKVRYKSEQSGEGGPAAKLGHPAGHDRGNGMIRSQVARGCRGNGLGRGLLPNGEEPCSAIKIVAPVAGYGCAIFQRSFGAGLAHPREE